MEMQRHHEWVYTREKIQSDGSLYRLKFIILVRGEFHIKENIGDTWSTTESISTLKCILANAFNHKAIVHLLDNIGAFLKSNVKHNVFVKL